MKTLRLPALLCWTQERCDGKGLIVSLLATPPLLPPLLLMKSLRVLPSDGMRDLEASSGLLMMPLPPLLLLLERKARVNRARSLPLVNRLKQDASVILIDKGQGGWRDAQIWCASWTDCRKARNLSNAAYGERIGNGVRIGH